MTTPGEFGPAIDVSRTGDIGRTGGMPNVEIHPNTAMQYVSRFLGQSIGAPSSLIPGLSNDAILQQGKAAAIDLAHGIQAQMDAAGSDFLSSVREAASLMHDAAKANLAASKGMTAAASAEAVAHIPIRLQPPQLRGQVPPVTRQQQKRHERALLQGSHLLLTLIRLLTAHQA
jgi:hypothetical protein